MKRIEPTDEDYERVERRLAEEDPRDKLMEYLARHEAWRRIQRERRERRRRLINRLSLGLLGGRRARRVDDGA
ncbi:MAG TPA: hypothetical protein VGJ77_11840 [Gaiellaceae bacterium]|jgi:hypothetical protein